ASSDAFYSYKDKQIRRACSKKTVGHNARYLIELLFQSNGVCNHQVVDIDDLVAVVGDKAFAVNRITSQLHNGPRHVTSRHWYYFHRQWKFTEGGNVFAFVCNTDKFPGYRCNDLFAGQCAAAPLDQVQLRIRLGRTVNINRHLSHP